MQRDLNQILATNLKFFMERDGSAYKNPNSLAIAAKLSANTVRNFLTPSRRTTTATKPKGYPTLDKLERVCHVLGCQVWELLHPDLARSLREREMYQSIERDWQKRESEMAGFKKPDNMTKQ